MKTYTNPWLDTLSLEMAKEIKRYRVTGYPKKLLCGKTVMATCTWRKVAELFAEEHPELDVCHGHQIEGKELCDAAMFLLGESYSDGWN